MSELNNKKAKKHYFSIRMYKQDLPDYWIACFAG